MNAAMSRGCIGALLGLSPSADGRDLWIESGALRFNPRDHVLLTNKPLDELEASSESGHRSAY